MTLSAICSGLSLAVLPIFLVAGLAPQIREELALSVTEIGAAISLAFLVGALGAVPAGQVADRMGPGSAVAIGAALSALSLAGIGIFAHSLEVLVVFLALAGLAMALTDTGFALLIASLFPRSSRGVAFGIKEAAIPAAILAVGISIPALSVALGWRWTTSIGVVPLVGLAMTFPRKTPSGLGEYSPRQHRSPESKPAHIARPRVAAAAAALGTAAASGVTVFLTQTAADLEVSPGAAGAVLAVGSVAGIITKISMGKRIDGRNGNVVETISLLMLTGSASMAVGAFGWSPLLILATIGALGAGAGWSGLLLFALAESRPEAVGAAAGIGIAGLAIGSAIGPFAFGLTIEHASLSAAWAGAAIFIGVGALLMAIAGRRAPNLNGSPESNRM